MARGGRSALEDKDQEAQREQLLAADRAHRFVLSVAPLLRFTLLRQAPTRHLLVFTNHHILLDGWSVSVLLGELLILYGAGEDRAALPVPRPYADYLAWLAHQDTKVALAAWQDYLVGLEAPTRVAPPEGRDATPAAPERWQTDLSVELTARLQGFARERGLTLSTIVQGLWAVLLGRLTGRDDVVFGVTVAGRPAELAGVEQMVGLFINTVPMRVRLRSGEPLAALLASIQESQSRLLAHQHVGLAEILRTVGTGELFDTLVVFENYPVERAVPRVPRGGSAGGRHRRDGTRRTIR